MNILKWYLLHTPQSGLICKQCTPQVGLAWSAGTAASSSSKYNTKKTYTMPVPVIPTVLAETYSPSQIQQHLQNAVVACIWFLRVRMYGEWPEVDISRYECANTVESLALALYDLVLFSLQYNRQSVYFLFYFMCRILPCHSRCTAQVLQGPRDTPGGGAVVRHVGLQLRPLRAALRARAG
jgi:hypothetical protein